VEHTRNELAILSSINFDFIVNMRSYFKDNSNIFFVLDFAIGGEMWSHMRKRPGMKETDAMFYAAQMTLALEYLQERDIMHRDLKTENILIDHNGYLKLADFGFAKRVPSRTWTVCGTSEYMAPEIVREGKRHRAGLGLGEGYNKMCDWWAYGILVFEMANHRPPFRNKDKNELYGMILECNVQYPATFSADFVDLLRHILVTDPEMRYASKEVKSHRWFKSIVWGDLLNRSVKPPYVPAVQHTGDSGHFDQFAEEPIKNSETEEYPELFHNF
jgi:protein kinase A